MKHEDFVCTVEQGRKLKELGIIQDRSLFAYYCFMPDPAGLNYFHEVALRDVEQVTLMEHILDLFTVSELFLMFPTERRIRLEKTLNMERYYCYDPNQNGCESHETAAIACADKLINLIESGEYKVECANENYLK